jgi:uncharacterized membrane protein
MSWIIALHVIGSVFIIGPLAVLPMTGLRAIREGSSAQVRGLSRTVLVLGWLTVLVSAFGVVGFYVMNPEYRNKLGTAWLVWSVVLTLIALVLTLAVVVPQMNAAAKAIEGRKDFCRRSIRLGRLAPKRLGQFGYRSQLRLRFGCSPSPIRRHLSRLRHCLAAVRRSRRPHGDSVTVF